MNTPRYIEIFEERNEGGKSVLRYYGFDRKMHEVGSGNLQALVDCMDDSVFPNGVPNFDGKERYTVTLDLEHCTAENTAVRTASPYECKFVADGNFSFSGDAGKVALAVTVEMGSDDITDTAFNNKTGIVKIAEVTDDITITVEAQSHGV